MSMARGASTVPESHVIGQEEKKTVPNLSYKDLILSDLNTSTI